jgi:hypothetical protein
MSRRTIHKLLIASVVWILLIAGGAYMTYPAMGPVAVTLVDNPFWDLIVTGNPDAPFRAAIKTGAWLSWCLIPLALFWSLTWASAKRNSRRGA